MDAKGPFQVTFKYLRLQWGTIFTEKLQILCPQYFQTSFYLTLLGASSGVCCMYHTQQNGESAFHNLPLMSQNWTFGNSKQGSEMKTF